MDVPPEVSIKNIENRYSGDENKKDIHEKDMEYMISCYNTAAEIFPKLNVTLVKCTDNGKMINAEEINAFIFSEIEKKLGE